MGNSLYIFIFYLLVGGGEERCVGLGMEEEREEKNTKRMDSGSIKE
jgi:hypothetical protein